MNSIVPLLLVTWKFIAVVGPPKSGVEYSVNVAVELFHTAITEPALVFVPSDT